MRRVVGDAGRLKDVLGEVLLRLCLVVGAQKLQHVLTTRQHEELRVSTDDVVGGRSIIPIRIGHNSFRLLAVESKAPL